MSENNINLEAKDQPSEATTYGGLLRIARENKELSIDQVSSSAKNFTGSDRRIGVGQL